MKALRGKQEKQQGNVVTRYAKHYFGSTYVFVFLPTPHSVSTKRPPFFSLHFCQLYFFCFFFSRPGPLSLTTERKFFFFNAFFFQSQSLEPKRKTSYEKGRDMKKQTKNG